VPYADPLPPPLSPDFNGLMTGPGYLGCFVDNTPDGIRAFYACWGKDPIMAIEMCRDLAISQYLRHCGVQYGHTGHHSRSSVMPPMVPHRPFEYGLAPIAAWRALATLLNDVVATL
jgi:hypothetical protein